MYNTSELLGFSESFIYWIKLMHTDLESFLKGSILKAGVKCFSIDREGINKGIK